MSGPSMVRTIDGQRVYTTMEAVDLSGLTYRQVDYADRSGLISPSIAKARGTGTERLYSTLDIARLRLVHSAKHEPSHKRWTPRWVKTAVALIGGEQLAAGELREMVIVVYAGKAELMTTDDLAARLWTYRDVVTIILELFAGCGGAATGIRRARPDVPTIGIEWDATACRTRAAAGLPTVQADVSTYPTEPFAGKVLGLWMSPPCPDFSAAGIITALAA